jgi:hypothetical protein
LHQEKRLRGFIGVSFHVLFVPCTGRDVYVSNIGGDPEQEHFVDGVTESLTTDLSRIRGSFVIGRNTAHPDTVILNDLRKGGQKPRPLKPQQVSPAMRSAPLSCASLLKLEIIRGSS